MQTYRVKMNNCKSAGRRYVSQAPKGIRFFHVCSNSIAEALKLAEQKFPGECESVTVKKLADPALKISEMQEFENYELMSAPGSPNDTIIFRRNSQKISVILRGGNFSESGFSYRFNLSLLNMIKNANTGGIPQRDTLRNLEKLSLQIYEIIQEKKVPAIFKEVMSIM